ncbi:MAG: hypothetical protein OXE98_01555 [Hyphomicrobiales bacterium]|nr:hypothetical protein [Hyphomicrobiales bacterium]
MSRHIRSVGEIIETAWRGKTFLRFAFAIPPSRMQTKARRVSSPIRGFRSFAT